MNLNIDSFLIDDFTSEIQSISNIEPEYIQAVTSLLRKVKILLKSAPYVEETQGKDLRGWLQKNHGDIKNTKERLDWVGFILACACREKYLRNGTLPSQDGEWLLNYMRESNENISEEVRTRTVYINFLLPSNIATFDVKRTLARIEEKKSELENYSQKIDSTLTGADSRLSAWLEKVDLYESRLKEYRSNYNFLGLSHAFEILIKSKKSELFWDATFLVILAFIMLAIPAAFIYTNKHPTELNELLFFYIPAVGVEILLMFFFRVMLRNYYARKTLLIQLELRNSICAFYESYVDFTDKHKSDRSLDRFESLIFSGIVEDSNKLPTSFDGLDGIVSSILGAMKSK